MTASGFLWGILLIAAGVFICVYGSLLFQFVLAAIGFALGLGAGMIVTNGQEDGLRILVSLAIGGVVGLVFFRLLQFGLYVAGAILGGIIGLIVTALIGILSGGLGIIGLIVIVAGAGAGGFFAPRLGDMIIALATAAAGSFLVVYGLTILFKAQFESVETDPTVNFSRWMTLVLFAVIVAISGLAQFKIQDLRRRLLR